VSAITGVKKMSFIDGIKTKFGGVIAAANGQDYLSWAVAVALGGRPEQRPVLFGGHLALEVFGGLVVAVDMDIPRADGGVLKQRTWLPLLDNRNNPIPAATATAREISDAINRCRAKAMAMVGGIALALYDGETDAAKFLKDLGVKPDSDLASIQPFEDKKPGQAGAAYVSWANALAAARLTDPEFHWEVKFSNLVDPTSGEVTEAPYYRAGNTFMVAVKVTYKGQSHTEYLPVMGQVKGADGKRRDHVALVNPTSADWNRSVMRCLTKAIAVVSGYGLSTYAGEDLADLVPQMVGAKAQAASAPAAPAAPEAQQAPQDKPDAPAEASAQAPTSEAQAAPELASAAQATDAPQDQHAAQSEPSAKLTQAITRLGSIGDMVRLEKAIQAAPGLFGPEADAFIAAVRARISTLAPVKEEEEAFI
jgi:hypothetical protein